MDLTAASRLMKIRVFAIVLKRITPWKVLEGRLLYSGRYFVAKVSKTIRILCRRTNEKATEGFLVD
jgi:hypothetical protein